MLNQRKRTITLAILLLLTGSLTFAQPAPNTKIDSLKSVWLNKSLSDTSRMRALFDLAIDGYLYSQPDSARYFAEQLLKMAHSSNHKAFEADAYSVFGSTSYLQGRYSQALEEFQEFARFSEANGFKKRHIKALNNSALAMMHLGEFDEALTIFHKNLPILRTSGDSVEVAKCMNNIGLVLLNLNRFNEALGYFKSGLKIIETHNLPQLMSYARGNIATIYTYQGKNDSALAQFNEILEIHQKLNDIHGMITAHNSITASLQAEGDIPGALHHSKQCALLSEEIDDKEGVFLAMSQIGGIYRTIQELDSADTYFRKALNLSKNIGALSREANMLKKIGDIKWEAGYVDSARMYFEKCKTIRISIDDQPGISDILVAEAHLDKAAGDFASAEEKLVEAIKIQNNFADSLRLLTSYYNLGMLHMDQDNISKALKCGEFVYSLSKDFGGVEQQRNAHFLNYKTAKHIGNISDALFHHEQYIELRDQLINDENKKVLMRHQLQFEFERKELKLQAERAHKDAQTAIQLERQQRTIYSLTGSGLFLLALVAGGFQLSRQRQRNKALAESIAARDYERNRLSRELHDGIANQLFGIEMAVEGGKYTNSTSDLTQQLTLIRTDVRHISHDLAMPDIQHTTLPEMTRYLTERWTHVGRDIQLSIDPKNDSEWDIKTDKALHLYRILQEGLTNALRYSKEDQPVKVILKKADKTLKLDITNHYIETLIGEAPPGIGLKNLQERAELIGGSVSVKMEDGLAHLQAAVPLK